MFCFLGTVFTAHFSRGLFQDAKFSNKSHSEHTVLLFKTYYVEPEEQEMKKLAGFIRQ